MDTEESVSLRVVGELVLKVDECFSFNPVDLASIQFHPENDDEVTITDLINGGVIMLDDLQPNELNFNGEIHPN